jgi:glycerate kinase
MERPGAGAAGGIAFGLMAAANAALLPGFDLVSSWIDLDDRLSAADMVVTGEGRFDESSLSGKGPGTVVRRALAQGKLVHVFAGEVALPRRIPGLFTHAITPCGDAAGRGAPARPRPPFGRSPAGARRGMKRLDRERRGG